MADSNVFSTRIVSIDYYMAPPIPDLDICYSSFQGGKVNEVPVIRIYGSTPAGQKTCLHIHRALPYLYVPCADISVQPHHGDDAYPRVISIAIEKALKLRSNAGSKRQHVHGCSLVRARKLYGYHSTEELFVKIYLYYPHDVSRAANLLLGGAVMNKGLQPHESHIPFLLQFLIDYNLYGMGHLHVSKMKFRHPVPDLFSPRKANLSGKHGQETIHSTPVPDLFSPRKANLSGKRAQETIHSTSMVTSFQADPSGGSFLGSPVWISSTIPDGWLWQCTVELDVSPDPGIHLVKRQSSCELEGDAAVDEILNQQFKMYSSLSQTHSSVNMVQSLIPIWEEEYERTGVHETAIPPDPGKPNPEDVLKILLHGLELENKLVELGGEAEISSGSFEKDSRSPLSIGSSADKGSLIEQEDSKTSIKDGESLSNVKNILESVLSQGVLSEEDHIAAPSEEEDVYPKTLSFDELPPSDGIGTLGLKAADKEALGLLKWLTSSQAAEDINSDDELAHETILSPLFPATTIDKVLERANKEYESESHQECQDILDSIDDLIDFEGLKEGNSCSVNHGNSSGKIIPQVDGSGDEQYRTPGTDSFEIDITSESGRPSQHQLQKEMSLRSTSIHKKKDPFWGSLPFSIAQENVVQSVTCNMTGGSAGTKASTGTGSGKEADIYSGRSLNSAMANVCDSKEASLLVGGSVRDLMRKKRSYRLESPDSGTHKITKILLKEDSNERMLIQSQQLDFQTAQSVAQEMAPVESHIISSAVIDQQREIFGRSTCMATCALDAGGEASDVKPVLSNWSMYGKLPLSSCCDGLLQDYASKDRHFDSCEILDAEAAGNISVSCPLHEGTRNFLQPSYFEKQDSAVSGDHCKNCAINELGSASSSVVPVTCDGNTCSKPDKVVNRQLMKCDTEDKLLADDGLRQVDAAGLSHCSTCNVEADMSRKDTYNCKSSHKSCNFFECAPGRDNCSYMSGCSVSKVVDIEAKPTGLVSMTLCKRPPTMDWADGTSENVLWSPTLSNCPLYGNGEICKGTSVQGRGADEYLPFFDNRGEKEVSNKCHIKKDFNSLQGVKGVPTHYQNDGSVLYMLTPMFSPPSRDSVSRWLLHDDSGTSRENSRTVLVKPSSVKNKGLSTGLLGPQGSPADTCYNVLPESCSDTHVKPILSQPNHEKHQCLNTEERISCNDVTPPLRSEGSTVTLKKCSDCSQDVSQISGPAGNLKPTPVSQMGFQDSASVGGGQQLTLFSIEVLAESRGDLRPNPKFDAINIIALAIQEDNDDILDVNVLLRSNTESYQRNHHGISGCKVLVSSEEKLLLKNFLKIIHSFDPDILLGWDIQGGSLGFLAERAAHLGIDLLNDISRTPSEIKAVSGDSEIPSKGTLDNIPPESLPADSILLEDAIIEDEWGRTHASGIHVGGRVVLNVWRLMRSEVKLNMYTIEAVAEAVLRRKVPLINYRVLTKWYSSGPGQARYRCIEYAIQRSKLNLQIMNKLDMINRTSELARVFGIDFFSVLSRGSQYRVESMLLRLSHTQNYLAISPGRQQVASQPAMECLPLVMEPESGFYADPVVVLDFQSLYPSMIIAYNLCFCTCLGKILSSKPDTLGVSSFAPDPSILRSLRQKILLTPNGVMYVPSKVCKGILPRLLEEILSTRIMVKQAMKKLTPSQQVLYRILNARQLALKLIANVTYGYTAAGFSGRMPCAELADSIVQCGRRTLENAISFVNAHDKWKARVIYGDTDSMFVLLKGRTVKEAFQIGQEIASAVTTMNPNPVTLKMEKVYQPCILVTKKRYVGYSYESPDQLEPVFDAKGIETVRRDTCSAVAKMMEQSLRLFFEYQDLLKVKSYLQRQWTRILSGRVSLQDFVFAKEVRLGAYSTRASSSLPPAAIVAMKAMRVDPRAEPRYAERIPYVVIHGEPGARLVDMVVDPLDLLSIDSPFRLNDLYYINKQIIPALQRIFGLVGNDLNQWFLEMPRPIGESLAKRHFYAPNLQRTRIDYYYLSKHCVLCGELVHASAHLCNKCSNKGIAVAAAVTGRTSKLEREMQHLAAICCHCGGGDWVIESGVKCTSLACTVFFERRKVQKELLALSAVAADAGFYPRCMIEWF